MNMTQQDYSSSNKPNGKPSLTLPVVPPRNNGFRKKQDRESHSQELQNPRINGLKKKDREYHSHELGTPDSQPKSRIDKPPPLPLPRPSDTTKRSHPSRPNSVRNDLTPNLPSQIEQVNPDDTQKLRLLGHGSGGKVYQVKHKRTGKLYALKIIQEKQEPAVCKQILTEMDILRRASNPYVVQCYGASEKGGEISFVLEYMDGGSLADVIEAKKPISERYLSEIAKQVLKGLDYLHRNKIVHRDIKPSNILLGRKQEVKIADFGVSTILASTMAACNTFVGTCAYMSPERFDPDSHGGNYGYAADIWSLGLSLLECFVGRFPFLGQGEKGDWPTLMFAICYNQPPSAPDHASPEFKDFIRQCLQKDPSLRPRASTLLNHPFVTKFDEPAPLPSVQARPSNLQPLQRQTAANSRKSESGGHNFWGSFSKAVSSIFS